jgi:outer membrane protein assembly factor BamB
MDAADSTGNSHFADNGSRHVLFALALLLALSVPAMAQEPPAKELLDAAGVKGGLVIHLGCGDGTLTTGLRVDARFTVQGLEADTEKVRAARERLTKAGLYGPISIEAFSGAALPYVDNLVNLLVVDAPGAVPMDEVLRVIAPGGVAMTREGDGWKKTVKPRPANIDEWTHFLHDASNNAVARDEQVGPARGLRWVADPLWLRSHETPSGLEALVCGGGRVFYIFDEGLIGITDQRLPERWSLVCRDAFNGKLLWKKPLGSWGWPEWARDRFEKTDWTTINGGRTAVPDENQRRLVVDGDRVYATLSYRAPLSILDAATGQVRATIEKTDPVSQILVSDGVVLVYSQDAADAPKKNAKKKAATNATGTLFAIDGAAAKILWEKEIPAVRGLSLAVDGGRVIAQTGGEFLALDLKTGNEQWRGKAPESTKTMVVKDGVVALLNANGLEALDAATGKSLWKKQVLLARGLGSEDLFVIDGILWPAILAVDENQKPSGKSADALGVGYDLRTGEERKRVFAKNLRSPEHHHRCYRNKATSRYIITSMEGAEFLDLQQTNHSQDNFVRGACKLGMMPCNGLLYVPPDQCFCEPGAKVLGFAAATPKSEFPKNEIAAEARLERGPAYGKTEATATSADEWPTFRHDPARHGSTAAAVSPTVEAAWTVKLGGGLTAPVSAGGRVFVASRDAHTIHALDLKTGQAVWQFVAGGRIDSPPTLFGGLVLFGSADGRVYALRASDGALAWRFLAAPADRRIAAFDQVESVWPVHGSVLVENGVAYCTAGRSTYLDGGIRLYALEPATGKVLHQGLLEGPFPDGKTRDVSFYILGANSDVLVSEDGALFMRQKRLTPELKEVEPKVLSTKGEADVGLHVFSTAGLLDGSWYNRTFWMYSKRWPGFQLANQAPKEGQLLTVDGENTYAVKAFYRRNVHSLMFFPGKEGCLLYADKNTNEPQIVGEQGARSPLEWLPQSGYKRPEGERKLDSPAFGFDKMIGYTRADPPLWTRWVPVRVRAMVKTAQVLFAAGPPDEFDAKDPYASFEGRKGARLVAVSTKDGAVAKEQALESPPVFDGMIAVPGRLVICHEDGRVSCWSGKE